MKLNGKEIVVCAPSYKRPKAVDTLKYLPSVKIYVAESEADSYRENNPPKNIVAVPDSFQGNVCRIRNKILDENKGKIACIIDDDLRAIYWFEGKERKKIANENEFYNFLLKYSILADDLGVKLWGINVNPDKQCYREYTPFSMVSYIGSPFMVHMDTDLRFDERFSLKEDYDFTLQALNKYRKVLRVNKYSYEVKQMEQTGGCATYRNVDRERAQLVMLREKWGKKIVREDSLENSRSHKSEKIKRFDVNPIILAPIRGV